MVAPKRSALALAVFIGAIIAVVVHVFDVIDAPYLRYLAAPGAFFEIYLGFFVAGSAHGGFASEWAEHLTVFGFNLVVYSGLGYCILRIAKELKEMGVRK